MGYINDLIAALISGDLPSDQFSSQVQAYLVQNPQLIPPGVSAVDYTYQLMDDAYASTGETGGGTGGTGGTGTTGTGGGTGIDTTTDAAASPVDAFRSQLSGSSAGRGNIFRQLTAGTSPFLSPTINNAYDPLEAMFTLQQLAGGFHGIEEGAPGTNFRTFLQNQGQGSIPGSPASNMFRTLFSTINNLSGGDAGIGQEYFQVDPSSGYSGGRGLVTQAGLSGVNPFLRGLAENRINRNIDQWRQQDPTGNLFDEYIRRGQSFF
jgi:hypothetical protein